MHLHTSRTQLRQPGLAHRQKHVPAPRRPIIGVDCRKLRAGVRTSAWWNPFNWGFGAPAQDPSEARITQPIMDAVRDAPSVDDTVLVRVPSTRTGQSARQLAQQQRSPTFQTVVAGKLVVLFDHKRKRLIYLLASQNVCDSESQVRDLVLLASADGRRPHVYLPQDCRPHADKFINVLIERVRVLLFFPVESSISQNGSISGSSGSSDSGDDSQAVAEVAAQNAQTSIFNSRNKTLTTQAPSQQQQEQAKPKESSPGQESGTNIEYIDRYEDLIDSDEETQPDKPDIYLSRIRKLKKRDRSDVPQSFLSSIRSFSPDYISPSAIAAAVAARAAAIAAAAESKLNPPTPTESDPITTSSSDSDDSELLPPTAAMRSQAPMLPQEPFMEWLKGASSRSREEPKSKKNDPSGAGIAKWLWERLRTPNAPSIIPLTPNVSLVINKDLWMLPPGTTESSSSSSNNTTATGSTSSSTAAAGSSSNSSAHNSSSSSSKSAAGSSSNTLDSDSASSEDILIDPNSPNLLYLQMGEGMHEMTLVFKMGSGDKTQDRESVPKFLDRCLALPDGKSTKSGGSSTKPSTTSKQTPTPPTSSPPKPWGQSLMQPPDRKGASSTPRDADNSSSSAATSASSSAPQPTSSSNGQAGLGRQRLARHIAQLRGEVPSSGSSIDSTGTDDSNAAPVKGGSGGSARSNEVNGADSKAGSGSGGDMAMLYEVAKMILPTGSSTEDVQQLAEDLMSGPTPYSHPKSNTKVLAEKKAARRRLEIPKQILALGKSAQAKKGPAARKGLSRRRQPATSASPPSTPSSAAAASAKSILSSSPSLAEETPEVDLEQLLRRLRPSARDVRLLPASLNPVGADAVVLLQPAQLKALVAEWNTREQRVMMPPSKQ